MSGPKVTYVDHGAKALATVKARLMPRVEAAALITRDEIITVINESQPAGRTYRVPGTNAYYGASAPGQPPAIREGLYVNSWQASPAVQVGNAVMAAAFTGRRVGKGGEHVLGELLEYGTTGAHAMAPRPHARPAAARVKRKVRAILSGPKTPTGSRPAPRSRSQRQADAMKQAHEAARASGTTRRRRRGG